MPIVRKRTPQIPIFSSYSCNLDVLANHISAGLTVIDKEMKIVWHNKFQEGWFGKISELKGKHCYEVYEKRDKICTGCPTIKIFKHGYDQCSAIRRGIATAHNGKRCFKLITSPIRDSSGNVVQVLELVEDITEQLKVNNDMKKRLNVVTKELDLISKLDKQFISLQELSLDKVLQQIVEIAKVLIGAKICNLRLIDKIQKTLISKANSGLNGHLMAAVAVGEGITGRAASLKRPILIDDLAECKYPLNGEYREKSDFHSVLSVPILLKGEVIGTLTMYDKRVMAFTKEDCDLLSCFANHVSILIDNVAAHKEVFTSYIDTIKSLVSAIEARDAYTRGHSEKVTKFALDIADSMGFSEVDKAMLAYCGRLHDIGKIGVSDAILKKPGPLTIIERAEMQLHPIKAVQMLSDLKFLENGIPAIKHHHERFDGKGYPDGLKGGEIPIFARILACADSFDAMTSDRAYRPKMTLQNAIEEMTANKGKQFDPEIAEIFIEKIKTYSV